MHRAPELQPEESEGGEAGGAPPSAVPGPATDIWSLGALMVHMLIPNGSSSSSDGSGGAPRVAGPLAGKMTEEEFAKAMVGCSMTPCQFALRSCSKRCTGGSPLTCQALSHGRAGEGGGREPNCNWVVSKVLLGRIRPAQVDMCMGACAACSLARNLHSLCYLCSLCSLWLIQYFDCHCWCALIIIPPPCCAAHQGGRDCCQPHHPHPSSPGCHLTPLPGCRPEGKA
jgi:hypothetical protein